MNGPSDTVAKQDDVAQRTHKPLVLQSHALDCKTFDIIPLVSRTGAASQSTEVGVETGKLIRTSNAITFIRPLLGVGSTPMQYLLHGRNAMYAVGVYRIRGWIHSQV